MTPSQQIALNTGATYLRSVLAAAMAIFSSRWVMNGLGQSDYGLFNVVGSLIVFVGFFNNVLGGSSSRHFAFVIGKGDPKEVNMWFNTALSIHLFLPLLLILVGWPTGEYYINHAMNIPPDRISACCQVFRLSLVSAFLVMASVPFTAMFTAKQRIAELAMWGMLNSVLLFVLAWILIHAGGDRLMFYAYGTVAISGLIQLIQISRAWSLFPECRPCRTFWFNRARLQEIFSFASWSFIGAMGVMLRNQGSAILINLYFGTRVNAAYGIANQVSAQTTTLSYALLGALTPEITTSEGRGDRTRVISLAMRASKLGTLLILLFAIPLAIEIDYVLKLWLHDPPMYTAVLCQFILVTFIIDNLTVGHAAAVAARGKIAAYQATLGICQLMTLPLAWLYLRNGYSPASIGIAFVTTIVICALGRVYWAKTLLRISPWLWLQKVIIPCACVGILSSLMAWIPSCFVPASFIRLLISTSMSIASSILIAWVFVLDENERDLLIRLVKRIRIKLT